MFKKICICFGLSVFTATILLMAACWYGYRVKVEGQLELENAHGIVKIIREPDTMIPHIKGQNKFSAFYGQGFVHA